MSVRARESGLRLLATPAALGAGAALLAACGGKVVVDANGAGGGVAATATTGVVAATGTGGGDACAALLSDLRAKLDAAQTCNPVLDVVQCTGQYVAHDPCGCAVATADHGEIAEATLTSDAAYDAWTLAGCGPFQCDHCPPAPPAKWHCDGTTARCVPSFEK